MAGQIVKKIIRGALSSIGYEIRRCNEPPYGVDYMLDIRRLSQAWNIPILTFFDVGANIGQTSEVALSSFPASRIFAFEPHPQTFSELHKRLGKKQGFSAHNISLGEFTNTVPLFEYKSSLVNSLAQNTQFVARFEQVGQSIEVQCVTLDEFSEQNGIQKIDVLKIDTEGYDLFILRGASKMLSAGNISFVYTEFNGMFPKPGTTGGALIPICEFLGPFGFELISVYNDYIVTEGVMFMVANALFAKPVQLADN